MRQLRHGGRRCLVRDSGAQTSRLCLQSGAGVDARQFAELLLGGRRELLHLGVFGSLQHGAVCNSAAVVDGNVVEQLPHLFGLGVDTRVGGMSGRSESSKQRQREGDQREGATQ